MKRKSRKKSKKFAKPVPKVGAKIYVGTSLYLSHGEDDVEGGLATVSKVEKGISGGESTYYVSVKEHPGHSYNWEFLAEEQNSYRLEYGSQKARACPDYSPESNRWD